MRIPARGGPNPKPGREGNPPPNCMIAATGDFAFAGVVNLSDSYCVGNHDSIPSHLCYVIYWIYGLKVGIAVIDCNGRPIK